MPSYSYELLFPTTNRKKCSPWISAIGLAFLVLVNIFVLRSLRVPHNVLEGFQSLNSMSPIYEGMFSGNGSEQASFSIPAPDERAVVTTLYSESFVSASLALGHSLKAAEITARLILLYFPERLTYKSICRLQANGWELHPIVRIPPPNGGRGVHSRFLDQYSKLQLWTLDTLGIKAVVYLDSDTLVRRNFDELWSLPFTFAAVPDVYDDTRGFALSFNAGVMFLRTSSAVFDDMVSKIDSKGYRRLDAEQGFLNLYFASQVVRLPYIYNANLVIKQRNPVLWQTIEQDIRIVHYTMMKPFFEDSREGAVGGLWEAEQKLWEIAWMNVSRELLDKC